MKTLGMLLATLAAPLRRWNLRLLVWMLAALLVMIALYSVAFHQIMELEGRSFSWTTSIYWVLTVMSTLGFGDITFTSDLGRAFSVLVLVSGATFILVVLPFGFVQFVLAPWMRQRGTERAPRAVEPELSGHLVLTSHDPVTDALIALAQHAHVPYVLIVADVDEALALHDQGYRVMRGRLDDPDTYRRVRVEHAALVAATRADTTNTNIAFTVRERSESVPIVATANSSASVDVLELAGCDQVLELGDLLGRAIARRVVGSDGRAHVVGSFGQLRVAEAAVTGTDLVGRRLRELDVRPRFGINVLGVWRQGRFERTRADSELQTRDVLILAGTDDQLAAYDGANRSATATDRTVLILGGGRVGRAAGRALGEAGVPWRIVEQRPERIRDQEHYVLGDAAELEVLEGAGLREAAAVLVTTHEDDVNVYLTLYLRRLEPEVQIIARAVHDRNVSTLHRAGADAVLSYASLGATALWNASGEERRLVVAEGLEVFQVPVPEPMVGRSLIELRFGERTGCDVLALERDGVTTPPDPQAPLPDDADLVVIGDEAAERAFLDAYPVPERRADRGRRRAIGSPRP